MRLRVHPPPRLRRASRARPQKSRRERFSTSTCVTCHNARLKTAGLLLDQVDASRVGDAAEIWEKVARKLRTREMPPPRAARPDAGTYASMTQWLEASLDRASEASPHPGRTPVHRLNRTEYANAIRDLLAVDVDARTLLSADEPAQHGFDNVASVLSVSPALLEDYLSTASTVSRLAVGDPTLNSVVDVYKVPTAMVQDDRASESLPFGSRGGTVVRYQFPLDGEYLIKVVLKRQLYLYLMGMGEPHQIDIRLDGALLKRFTSAARARTDGAGELRRQHAGRRRLGSVHAHCGRRARGPRPRQGGHARSGRVVRQARVGAGRRAAAAAARVRADDERAVFRQAGRRDGLHRGTVRADHDTVRTRRAAAGVHLRPVPRRNEATRDRRPTIGRQKTPARGRFCRRSPAARTAGR